MARTARTFTIEQCLGRGGFGEVYRARMNRGEGLDADVAVKVLRRDIDPKGQAVQRLRDEGRVLATLNHPTILKVHDLVILEGRISLVTEFVDGVDLTDALTGPNAMSPRALLEVISLVAGALDAAWNSVAPDGRPLHMVHRDIKPSNIRVTPHGTVKLLDFGIARTDSMDREARTQTDMMVGSPPYMAPERFLESTILPQSDVFALGTILYEGITGERFWAELSVPRQVGIAVDQARFVEWLAERLALIGDSVPEGVRHLLQEMLQYEPSDRPMPDALAMQCDAVADEIRGATLPRWCRSFEWSRPPGILHAELLGRTVTEGTLETRISPPSMASLAPPAGGAVEPGPMPTSTISTIDTAPPPSTGRLMLAGAGGAVGVVLVLAVLGVGGIAVAFQAGWLGSGATAEETDEPVAEVPTEEEPSVPADHDEGQAGTAEEPEPQPEAEPEPAPVQPQPQPVPRAQPKPKPKPTPAPVPEPEPTPAAAPQPAAPVVPTVAIGLQGDVRAELRSAGGKTFALPGKVPVGAYQLFAMYNARDFVSARSLDVVEGKPVTVQCSSRMMSCSVR